MTEKDIKELQDRVEYNENRNNAHCYGPIMATSVYRELLEMAKRELAIRQQVEANT